MLHLYPFLVSILNKTIYDSNNQISLKGIWFPNANMAEFEKIYYLLEDCNIKINLLVIPVFLDDTREEKVRDTIQNYDNKSCFNSKFTKDNKTIKKGNVEILNNKIKKEIKYSFTLISIVQLDRNTNGIIPVVNKINITEITSTPSL